MSAMARALVAALALLWLLLGTPAQAGTRSTTPLDGPWRFQRADVAGAEAPDFDDTGWSTVSLPHTYNGVDGEAGGAYYRGPAWYRRLLELPAAARERRRFIEFDGAALVADVWVNGRHAGRHEGGYARFRFDITELLRPGRNTLAVRVDNAGQQTVAPLGGDFTVFGGLYRRVRLIETAPQHVDLLDHGGPGLYVDAQPLSPDAARLQVAVRVSNHEPTAQRLRLRLTLRDAQGRVVLRRQQAVEARPGDTAVQRATLMLERPRLWQGVHDPYLYRLSAELLERGKVVDEVSVPVGVRRVEVDPQRGLLLNGRPYALHGVNYFHPGRPGKGLAVGDAEIDEDLRILQELGVSGLRLVHFQHPQRVYERADELGLLLWTEVPLNASLHDSAAFRANLAQQLRELMQQQRNHASVVIWGLGNEVYQADDTTRAQLAELHRLARQEDPGRLTAYAHCCAADDHPIALQADITGYNRYYGWYDQAFSDIGPWADALHRRLPSLAIGLSEYGAGASVLQQQDPPQRPVPNGRWHPEQYQALFHEAYWAQISRRPWLWSSFVWVGFDLASAGRNEGDRPGINDKGLVTYDRRFRKDAYHFYRAHWSALPMVHIGSRRFTPRPAGVAAVKVYSNARRVTLRLNGERVGSMDVVDRIAVWPEVRLQPGRNEVSVTADNGASDSVVWEATP
jgi:beta-galactosidase